MHIIMLETRRGSEDGFALRRFHAGLRYDVADSMARDFIRKGWAMECELPNNCHAELVSAPTPPSNDCSG